MKKIITTAIILLCVTNAFGQKVASQKALNVEGIVVGGVTHYSHWTPDVYAGIGVQVANCWHRSTEKMYVAGFRLTWVRAEFMADLDDFANGLISIAPFQVGLSNLWKRGDDRSTEFSINAGYALTLLDFEPYNGVGISPEVRLKFGRMTYGIGYNFSLAGGYGHTIMQNNLRLTVGLWK